MKLHSVVNLITNSSSETYSLTMDQVREVVVTRLNAIAEILRTENRLGKVNVVVSPKRGHDPEYYGDTDPDAVTKQKVYFTMGSDGIIDYGFDVYIVDDEGQSMDLEAVLEIQSIVGWPEESEEIEVGE